MDDAISQLINITGTTPAKAQQYLQVSDGDVEQAVTLFFENDGADLGGGPSTSTQPTAPASSHNIQGDPNNPINIDDEEHISDDNDPEITGFRRAVQHQSSTRPLGADVDADAALARQLQEEMYGGGGGQGPGMQEDVRAPIARQSETLVGTGAMASMSDMESAAEIQSRIAEYTRRRANRPGIFNQQDTPTSIWNEEAEMNDRNVLARSTGGASETSSTNNALARMFQPPWTLMYRGSWDSARDDGKDEKKWLLVDIQDGSIFDCQLLNRDLWKDASVADTVRENFIFMQYSKDDPRAEPYLNYYFHQYDNSDLYPHVAIVDPRTGEQVKLWSRNIPKAPEFLMQLHEFLDRYSLNNANRNPVAKRKPEKKVEKELHQMTEEEMMEKAMQESIAAQSNNSHPHVEDPDDLTRSIGDLRNLDTVQKQLSGAGEIAMDTDQNGAAPEDSQGSTFKSIPADRPHAEPAAGADITRIQFRHPAGRIVRRFATSDPVQRLYEWLKADPLDGKEGVEFELISMGKNLETELNQSIESAGLKNATVMVQLLEE